MNEVLARQIALAGASGLLYPLCFPNWDLGYLAWIVLVPLHLAIDDVSPRRAFYIGWASGTLGFMGIMSWVTKAMSLYGKMPEAASYAVLLLLAAYLALYIAVYALLVAWTSAVLPSLVILVAPTVWVALELIRTYFLSGFPWALLGYSQSNWLPVIQIADHTGVYGVSFLLVLVNVALADLFSGPDRGVYRAERRTLIWLSPALAVTLAGGAHLYGYQILQTAPNPSDYKRQAESKTAPTGTTGRAISIGLVQANIDQARKWDVAYRRETLDQYARLTAKVAERSDLIMWPEAATPFFFEKEPEYRLEVTAMAHAANVPLVFGSPALRFHPDRRPYLLNSVYLLSPDGQIMGRHDKQHLVPFGEYIPFHSSLLSFLDKLVEGIGDFEAGKTTTIFTAPLRSASSAGKTLTPPPSVRFGVVICYEVIFPDLVRRFVEAGVDFMATVTNDAWFGHSVAPYQHFGMVVFRSVENRVAFARAANTGISGVIDPYGRILETTPIFAEAAFTRRIPIGQPSSFYTKHGDTFAKGCVILAGLLWLSVAIVKRRRRKREAEEITRDSGGQHVR